MIFIFLYENGQNSISWAPTFGSFWSVKYLNFRGESCEIRILSRSLQETYTLRKVKNQVSLFLLSWEPNLSDLKWSKMPDKVLNTHLWPVFLTLSRRTSLLYRNLSIDLQSKSKDWFLSDRDLRHERVNYWSRVIMDSPLV